MTAIHWRFPISGLFTTARNWNPAQVPTASDNALIDAPGTYTVTSPTSRTVRTLTTVSTATLAVTGGTFAITSGTGSGSSAGTIAVDDAADLAIGGTFTNRGKITLNSTGHRTGLEIIGTTTLNGSGSVTLGDGGPNFIGSNGFAAILVNGGNTIAGAGLIGDTHLTLVNEQGGVIDGNSTTGALTLNTGTRLFFGGSRSIANAGLIEGTTAQGLVIVSNVSNSGTLAASGTNARLQIDGTVTDITPPLRRGGIVTAIGHGAHIDLSSATISQGRLQIGSGSFVETLAGSGLSIISGVTLANSGTLEANSNSELRIQGSTIGTTGTLMSNGTGALLDVAESVGAVSGAISGGEIEFQSNSAAHVAFTSGTSGTLKLDASTAFTGTISGFSGAASNTFTQFIAFGDSTIDSGAFQYLSTGNANKDARIQNALANGGTATPVGVGSMNSQILAGDFGLTASTAYAPGGGGTNYAISGALDAATDENGNTSNLNPGAGLLSTVDQISSYLSSTINPNNQNAGAHADPNALYLISSGANDVSYASANFSDQGSQQQYLSDQAANLTAAIEQLVAAGAQYIIVDNIEANNNLAKYYSTELFGDLDTAGVPYVQGDIHAMLQDIKADPTAFGFAADAIAPGIPGTATESALIEPDTVDNLSGWGQWGANTTTQETGGVPLNEQYAYLRSPDAEQTSLFSDDQHLSAAGQQIEADYVYSLLVANKVISQDAIDLTDISYSFGTTKATYSGDTTGGTLSVTDGIHTANIALLGNYIASTFVTANDGNGGTLVVEHSNGGQQILLAQPHPS